MLITFNTFRHQMELRRYLVEDGRFKMLKIKLRINPDFIIMAEDISTYDVKKLKEEQYEIFSLDEFDREPNTKYSPESRTRLLVGIGSLIDIIEVSENIDQVLVITNT